MKDGLLYGDSLEESIEGDHSLHDVREWKVG